MRDPEQPLREAYLAALRWHITLNGNNVPVYAAVVPSSVPRPYICISEIGFTDGGTGKMCPSYDCTVLVDIGTEFNTNATTVTAAALIGEAVLRLSEQVRYHLFGWDMNSHKIESSAPLLEDTPAKVVNRRLLRFRDRLFDIGQGDYNTDNDSANLLLETEGDLLNENNTLINLE